MKEKVCPNCEGRGTRISHTPDKDSAMFALLDLGATALFKSIKGRRVECERCEGTGVIYTN